MTKGKVSLFSALLAHWALVTGIRLENVLVPQYGIKDGSQTLKCFFELGTDTLLVLKWYKDGHEFFRVFYSSTIPHSMIFPVDGVTVDTAQSNINQVVLKDINLQSSGIYKCEVSAEMSFRTLSKQGYMIVIAPPLSHPEITGFRSVMSVGDTLHANCTSFHSKPPASLMFYINEEKAEAGDMIEYLPISESNGLETSILGLSLQTESRHFRNGILEIKCTATIGNVYGVGKKYISEATINAQPSVPGRNRHLSDSTSSKDQITTTGMFLLLLLFVILTSKVSHLS